MGAASWAVPVGILAAIVVIAFAFVWWWFPRAWNRGNKKETDLVQELSTPEREALRVKNREIIERYTRARAIERGEIPADAEPVPLTEPVNTAPEVKGGVSDVREGEVVR